MITVVEEWDAATASMMALSNLNWKPKKESVFIKPNIGAASRIANTDVDVVRGVILYLRRCGIQDITVGDGSVETEYERTTYNFEHYGWTKLAQEENVELVDLNRTERINIPWYYGEIALPKLLFSRSYINIAKMKTHMQSLISLTLKNQKGLVDSSTRKQFHRLGLHEPIARLSEAVKPEVCMVDGIMGLEGNGPGDLGKTKKVGVVVAGYDMVEVDRACCRIMGIDPGQVEHIQLLSKEETHFPPQRTKRPFKLPEREFRMFRVYMRPENACTACMSSVGKMNKLARRSLKGVWYFFNYGILRRLDIVIGNPEKLPENHGEVIFYGDCAYHIYTKEYPNYVWIQGCPPNSKKALDLLTR